MISTRSSPSSSACADDVVEVEDLALGEGVRRVAVDAPQVAGRQPDEHAGQARERALSLEAAIDLMDDQRPRRLSRRGLSRCACGCNPELIVVRSSPSSERRRSWLISVKIVILSSF